MNIEKWRGFLAKMPSSSSSRRRGTEEGKGASAPVNPGDQGPTAARDRGKRERVGRRTDPRPHLVPGWSVAVRPRRPAAAGGGVSGGGAAVEERGREVAARFEVVGVVLGGCSAVSFIGGQGGGGGERLWAALMEWGRRSDATARYWWGVNGGSG